MYKNVFLFYVSNILNSNLVLLMKMLSCIVLFVFVIIVNVFNSLYSTGFE